MSPIASQVIIGFCPLMVVAAALLARSTKLEASQRWYARAGAVAEEALYSMRTVAAFGGEARELARYEAQLGTAASGGFRAGLYAAGGFAWLFFVFGCAYGTAFLFTAHAMYESDGDSDLGGGGDVIQVLFAAIIGVSSISDAAMPVNILMNGLAAGANLFKVLEQDSLIEYEHTDPVASKSSSSEEHSSSSEKQHLAKRTPLVSLRFENVAFSYPSRPELHVLSSVSLVIEGGQKVAFVGESGCGKSTLVQLLERFYDPARGAIYVNDADLRAIDVRAWRRTLGYVGQEPVLFAASVARRRLQLAGGYIYDRGLLHTFPFVESSRV